MSIEIQQDLFWRLELEHVVTRLFRRNCLKLCYSGLESNITLFSRYQNSKVNIFIKKRLLFGDLNNKTQTMYIIFIKSNIPFIWDFPFTIFRYLLLVIHSQLQLISRCNKIEMNILFCCKIESKLQIFLGIIK